MKLKYSHILFAVLFIYPFILSAETSNGRGSASRASQNQSQNTSVTPEPKVQKGKCPTPLKEWVLDDYTDKSTLFVFKFNSEANVCNTAVTSYQKFMNGKNAQTSFQKPESLSAELNKQFSSTISPNLKLTLEGCNTELTPEQSKVAQTRFYAAATRVEKFNKAAVDEIAYLDSITEGTPILEGIECTQLMPELKTNCDNLRNSGGQCKGKSADRFEEQFQKTMDNIAKIEALKEAEAKCKAVSLVKCAGSTRDCPMRGGYTFTSEKTAAKKCENISKAIEILSDEVPWIRGEVFDKIARKKISHRSDAKVYLSKDKIKEGMRAQLKANRSALATAYNENLENFRCIMYDTNRKGEKCDFEKVRTDLAKLDNPKIPQLADSRTNAEFKTYFDAESCLLDRGEDRAMTKNIMDNAAVDAGLTIVTAGLGSIAVGAKVIGGLSKTALATRRGAFAGTLGVDAYFAQEGARQAYKSCTSKTTAILENLSVKDKQKNMVCDSAGSQINLARETNSSCMVDALLAGADLLPFLGAAAPILARNSRAMAASSNATAATSTAIKTSDQIKAEALAKINSGASAAEIRAVVGQLPETPEGRAARLELAAKIMKRDSAKGLTSAEEKWILDAHDTHADTAYGQIGTQRVRDKINAGNGRPASISAADTRLLMESGVLGTADKNLYEAAALKAMRQGASDKLGLDILTRGQKKPKTYFVDTENRLAGERLLRYEQEGLKDVAPTPQKAQELAVGFFEKDYQVNIEKINKLKNPSWRDYSMLSTAAMRTGRTDDAVKYLKLEADAIAKDSYQAGYSGNATESLSNLIKSTAADNRRAPAWLKVQIKTTLESIIQQQKSKGTLPSNYEMDLNRHIRDNLN